MHGGAFVPSFGEVGQSGHYAIENGNDWQRRFFLSQKTTLFLALFPDYQ
jgi:hypothetical protein